MTQEDRWRRCSACKESIRLGARYWTCNVSTCNQKRTGLVFCTVSCWEVHLPTANHRETWAVECTAPLEPEAPTPTSGPKPEKRGRRRFVTGTPSPSAPVDRQEEVLIIGSRLKDYIRGRSGFSTSDKALGPLSRIVRRACDEAIKNASRDGRKTVLDRDIPR